MSSSNGPPAGVGPGAAAAYSNLFGYTPSKPAALAFIVLFGISTLVHFGQTVFTRRRYWWTLVFTAGGIMEVVGWAGRLLASQDATSRKAFLMQIVCLVIAPAWFSAACYQVTGSLIYRIGRQGSLLTARTYTIIFVSCDVISIVIQASGGATAGAESDRGEIPTKGKTLLLAGVAFQLGTMIIYLMLSLFFFLRRWSDISPLRRRLVASTVFASTCIIVRGILRTLELSEGWRGYIFIHEYFTIFLDGLPILFSVLAFNIIHPNSTLDVDAPGPSGGVAETDELDEKKVAKV